MNPNEVTGTRVRVFEFMPKNKEVAETILVPVLVL